MQALVARSHWEAAAETMFKRLNRCSMTMCLHVTLLLCHLIADASGIRVDSFP